ncbi:uncharacterized protein LOC131935988 isoform X2 [Physella acuta]|nr:uncharacterized protein LOC131935988 isoform X2 [Physella acuta]
MISVNQETSDSTDEINQLIANLKSNLENRNTHLQGKLTFTIGESSEVDVNFQSTSQQSSSSRLARLGLSNNSHSAGQISDLVERTNGYEIDSVPTQRLRTCPEMLVQTELLAENTLSKPLSKSFHHIIMSSEKALDGSKHNRFSAEEYQKLPNRCEELSRTQDLYTNFTSSHLSNDMHSVTATAFLPDKMFSESDPVEFDRYQVLLSTSPTSNSNLLPFEKVDSSRFSCTLHDEMNDSAFNTSNHKLPFDQSEIIGSLNNPNESSSTLMNSIQENTNNTMIRKQISLQDVSVDKSFFNKNRDDLYMDNNLSDMEILTADSFLNKKVRILNGCSADNTNEEKIQDNPKYFYHEEDRNLMLPAKTAENHSQQIFHSESGNTIPEAPRQTIRSDSVMNFETVKRINVRIDEEKILQDNPKYFYQEEDRELMLPPKTAENHSQQLFQSESGNTIPEAPKQTIGSDSIMNLETLKRKNVRIDELQKLSHAELVSILSDILYKQEYNMDHNNSEFSHNRDLSSPESPVHMELKEFKTMESFSSASVVDSSSLDSSTIATSKKKKAGRKGINPTKIKNSESVPIQDTYSIKNRRHVDVDAGIKEESDINKNNTDSQLIPVNKIVTRNKKQTNSFLKSDTQAQPLKKRFSLRSALSQSTVSDRKNIFSEFQYDEVSENNSTIGSESSENKPVKSSKIKQAGSYHCKECPKTFLSKVLYRRHVRSHSSGYQCDKCGKTLKTKDSLYHHQRGLHSEDKPYKCKQCNATFNFHHSYKLHIQRHRGDRPHKCDTCHKTYLTSNHLKVHIEAAHGVRSKICHICGKTFSYSCSLKEHLHKHTGDHPYNCNKCSKRFTSKPSLKAHLLSHISSKNYSCDVCGNLYKSEHSKNVHMKRHTKQVRQFVCELCGKSFLFKSTLKTHFSTHSKVRPYVCTQCGKGFKSKATLYTHKYVHRESHAFPCNICGKAFKTKHFCAAHMKRHKNDTSFSCTQCSSTFPDKAGLSKHMKTIHLPKKQFICIICGKKGTRGDNMRTHVKNHKKDLPANANPSDFIKIEMISNLDSVQGIVRQRKRGPKQRVSKRLCPSEPKLIDVQPAVACKLEVPTLQPTLINMSILEQQQYNSDVSFLPRDEYVDHNNPDSQLDQQHSTELYQHDQNKAPYYLTYLHQQAEPPGAIHSSTISFNNMANLLSAINQEQENSAISASVFHNTLASLQSDANHHSLSTLYNEHDHGALTHLQQILQRTNDISNSNLLEHQNCTTHLNEGSALEF